MLRAALLLLWFVPVACDAPVDLTQQAPATLSQEPPGYEIGRVTRVVDGDTVEVTITGRVEGPGAGEARIGESYDVRLLGIDTPETVAPNAPVECFGPEASAATHALLEGRTVRLVKDVEEVDSFGRLLRYVYLGGEMVDARLIVNGYARSYPYPPNTRHAALLGRLMHVARAADRGLWGVPACGA
jgi:micrococcal nuclease